jgi:hypothetical protein
MTGSARAFLHDQHFSRLAAAVGVALALAVAAVYYVKALSQLGDTASTNSSQAYDDREIAGGNSVIVDQQAAYEARALIPANAAYRVVTGSRLREKTELTETFVGDWFRYFLMPRRPRGNARWVICYGCDVSTLGGSYAVRWQDGNAISIGKVQ